MKASNKCISLIKQFEGCHLTAYKCPAGVWTIGYGHTAGVKEGMKISQAQAELYLIADLEKYEAQVEKWDSKYGWSQNEFDALVSFAYNIGSIDQLTNNGTRTRPTIALKILEYNKAGEKVLNGLTKRRRAEYDLFTSGELGMVTKTLRKSAKGTEVRELQHLLNDKGYPFENIDGIFGDETLMWVRAFQEDAGLTVDGIVGARTWSALRSMSITSTIKEYSFAKDGNTALTQNFKVKEFRCKDNSDRILVDEVFVRTYLQKIRAHFGVPVTINSAYRTAKYNKQVGGATNSYHVRGQAFDIVVRGVEPDDVARYAKQIGIRGVIQYDTFVHVDARKKAYYARNMNGKERAVNEF